MDCSLPGLSVHGISQARILEWVFISSSRGSSWPMDWTHLSCICRWILYPWASKEARDPSHHVRVHLFWHHCLKGLFFFHHGIIFSALLKHAGRLCVSLVLLSVLSRCLSACSSAGPSDSFTVNRQRRQVLSLFFFFKRDCSRLFGFPHKF